MTRAQAIAILPDGLPRATAARGSGGDTPSSQGRGPASKLAIQRYRNLRNNWTSKRIGRRSRSQTQRITISGNNRCTMSKIEPAESRHSEDKNMIGTYAIEVKPISPGGHARQRDRWAALA